MEPPDEERPPSSPAAAKVAPLSCAECGAPLQVPSEGDVVRCPYCKREHFFVRGPAAPSSGRARAHPAGSLVLVEWGGLWWNATVVSEEPGGRWRIHYDGWSDRWDETVGPDRIGLRGAGPGRGAGGGRTRMALTLVVAAIALVALALAVGSRSRPEVASADGAAPAPSESAPPGAALSPATRLKRGDPVWAFSHGQWWRAEVLQPVAARYEVRYIGWGPEWNETLDLGHLRARDE